MLTYHGKAILTENASFFANRCAKIFSHNIDLDVYLIQFMLISKKHQKT